jgi:hypothetical protein
MRQRGDLAVLDQVLPGMAELACPYWLPRMSCAS